MHRIPQNLHIITSICIQPPCLSKKNHVIQLLTFFFKINALCRFFTQKQPPEVLYKRGVLKLFQNSQGNTGGRVSFLLNLQVEACSFTKKRLWHRCFPGDFAKILRTHFFTKHLRATTSVYIEKHIRRNYKRCFEEPRSY